MSCLSWFRVLCLSLLFCLPAQGADGPSCRALIKPIEKLWSDFRKFASEFPITRPEEQLKPGDVLIFPFEPNGGEPSSYKNALENFAHAALIYTGKDRQGKDILLRADSPQPPPFLRREFAGDRPYVVLRPQNPPADFLKNLNFYASRFQQIGYPYDPLMTPEYLDKKKRSEMIKLCQDPKAKGSLPGQSCAELVATVQSLGGIDVPKGVTIRELLKLGMAEIKATDPKEREREAQKVAAEIIGVFTQGALQKHGALESALEDIGGQKKHIEENQEVLSGYLKDPSRTPPTSIIELLKSENQFLTALLADKENPLPKEDREGITELTASLNKYLEKPGVPPEEITRFLGGVLEGFKDTGPRLDAEVKEIDGILSQNMRELKQFVIGEAFLVELATSSLKGEEKPNLSRAIASLKGKKRKFSYEFEGKPKSVDVEITPVDLFAASAIMSLSGGTDSILNRTVIRPADFLKHRGHSGYKIVHAYFGNLPSTCPPPFYREVAGDEDVHEP